MPQLNRNKTNPVFANRRYGRLITKTRHGDDKWVCICDCGNQKTILSHSLRYGRTTSCGCFGKEQAAHASKYRKPSYLWNFKKTRRVESMPEWQAWWGAIKRCYYERMESYEHYGARGIRVCPRWLESFDNFLDDMGLRPDGHSLDRIDVNKDYIPENCRWATLVQQARNKRTNLVLTAFGESRVAAEWAEIRGINVDNIYHWIKKYGKEDFEGYLNRVACRELKRIWG